MGSQLNAQTPERSPDISICFTHTLYRAVIKTRETGISSGYVHGKEEEKYSQTSPYGHLYNTDISLLWPVSLVPEMPNIRHSLPLKYGHLCKADNIGSVPLVSVLKRLDCRTKTEKKSLAV